MVVCWTRWLLLLTKIFTVQKYFASRSFVLQISFLGILLYWILYYTCKHFYLIINISCLKLTSCSWYCELLASSRVSVCPSAWNNLPPTGRIFMKFYIWGFFDSLSWKFKFYYSFTRISDTVHEDPFTFITITSWILSRMRNVLD